MASLCTIGFSQYNFDKKKKRFVTRTWICTNRNRIFKNFEFSIDKKNMENMESVVNMENKVPLNGKKKRFSSIIGAMKGWYLLIHKTGTCHLNARVRISCW